MQDCSQTRTHHKFIVRNIGHVFTQLFDERPRERDVFSLVVYITIKLNSKRIKNKHATNSTAQLYPVPYQTNTLAHVCRVSQSRWLISTLKKYAQTQTTKECDRDNTGNRKEINRNPYCQYQMNCWTERDRTKYVKIILHLSILDYNTCIDRIEMIISHENHLVK